MLLGTSHKVLSESTPLLHWRKLNNTAQGFWMWCALHPSPIWSLLLTTLCRLLPLLMAHISWQCYIVSCYLPCIVNNRNCRNTDSDAAHPPYFCDYVFVFSAAKATLGTPVQITRCHHQDCQSNSTPLEQRWLQSSSSVAVQPRVDLGCLFWRLLHLFRH